MPRLFIALHLPESVKKGLLRLKMTIPTARWSDESQFHLTLRFLGDVEASKVGKIESALSDIHAMPFDMSLKGVGCFPENIKKPTRVLWAGLSAPKALYDLQKLVELAMIGAGFGEQDKPFNPHITLARLKTDNPLSQVEFFLKTHAGYATDTFRINEFMLVESQLHRQGAKYSDVKKFALG
ncbi:MAG: RNA 2',3'-cyclic phosphodiesterase [Anaerolineae bacterium]|jgi:2'-5' RNA ligase|nr:RNA 2',3'-cyclic phosphodiesterase [Anaerolineae bacterium]